MGESKGRRVWGPVSVTTPKAQKEKKINWNIKDFFYSSYMDISKMNKGYIACIFNSCVGRVVGSKLKITYSIM